MPLTKIPQCPCNRGRYSAYPSSRLAAALDAFSGTPHIRSQGFQCIDLCLSGCHGMLRATRSSIIFISQACYSLDRFTVVPPSARQFKLIRESQSRVVTCGLTLPRSGTHSTSHLLSIGIITQLDLLESAP